jgi:hypothetical protein
MTDQIAALRPIMAKLAAETGNLGCEIVDVAGDTDSITARIKQQAEQLHGLEVGLTAREDCSCVDLGMSIR